MGNPPENHIKHPIFSTGGHSLSVNIVISDESVGHDDNIYNIDDVDEDDDIMGDTISSKLSLVATIFGCIYDLCALPNLPYLKNFVFLYFAYLHF